MSALLELAERCTCAFEHCPICDKPTAPRGDGEGPGLMGGGATNPLTGQPVAVWVREHSSSVEGPTERAQIVAWLRGRGDCWSTDDEIATAIERGDHLTPTGSEQ